MPESASRLREFSPRPFCGPPNELASDKNENRQTEPSIEADRNETQSEHQHRCDHGEIVRSSVAAVSASAPARIQEACRGLKTLNNFNPHCYVCSEIRPRKRHPNGRTVALLKPATSRVVAGKSHSNGPVAIRCRAWPAVSSPHDLSKALIASSMRALAINVSRSTPLRE